MVLVDEEDRRYFKQQVNSDDPINIGHSMLPSGAPNQIILQEITLWRKAELGENRIPTSQFISNQLPNGHFKGSGDACESDQKNLQSAPTSTGETVEPPEEAF